MANRLAAESSPYLLQHADNPVDWYPWGPEAFERARQEDKPIFLSIGYAACHWCHVMAHESFENEAIAEQMNKLFINVKVDREERPEVDAIYMSAIQIMGQGGGWPLSAFCTPEGLPYYLGTYFAPTDNRGRPAFPRLLRVMAELYAEQRDKVVHNTQGILDGLQQIDEHYRLAAKDGDPAKLDLGMLITAGRQLAEKTDALHGGFGAAPKFPSSSSHELLARAGRLTFGDPAAKAFLLQCQKMAAGGIYDHLGGGFARYAVDETWLVPHFEKMLYDNAQLLALYGDAFAMTGDTVLAEVFAGVIEETLGWLDREMTHESHALYASQDADSEGQEGKFYAWTPEQVRRAVGTAASIQFCASYGITDAGNFENQTTVLSRVTERGDEAAESALSDMREVLFEVRSHRAAPETDTKILAGWNGLAISGLVRAWAATGSERALAKALQVGEFLAGTMLSADGCRIARVCKDGVVRADGAGQEPLDGTIDDYAFCAAGFFALAEGTMDQVWWTRGVGLTEAVIDRFYQERDGVGAFYMVPEEGTALLVHRPESNHDGAIPSGAAVSIENLLRLGMVSGDARAMAIAETYLAGRSALAVEHAFAASRLLAGLDLYLHGVQLVVTEGHGRDELLEAARRTYAPTLMIVGAWGADELLAGKEPSAQGGAQAYVCRGQSCSAPISDPGELSAMLGETP